jgi:hypothetical protein
MKASLVVLTVLMVLLTGACLVATGYVLGQRYPAELQTLPIKLLDADIAHLTALTHKGDTYTRFAEPSGAWGIVAVRMKGGIWVVPCYEVGARVSEGNK